MLSRFEISFIAPRMLFVREKFRCGSTSLRLVRVVDGSRSSGILDSTTTWLKDAKLVESVDDSTRRELAAVR